jgi:hypothetical protein
MKCCVNNRSVCQANSREQLQNCETVADMVSILPVLEVIIDTQQNVAPAMNLFVKFMVPGNRNTV